MSKNNYVYDFFQNKNYFGIAQLTPVITNALYIIQLKH